jgi:ABC-2 type transport system ATP-binding protein
MLSTHILPEAQQVCERVIIINEGAIIAEDTPENLTAQIRRARAVRVRMKYTGTDAAQKLRDLQGVSAVRRTGDAGDGACYELEMPVDGRDMRTEIAAFVVGRDWGLLEMTPIEMTLEDVFLRLTMEEEGAA